MGLAAWVRAARAAPVMINHSKNHLAPAARGGAAQGSACTHCYSWEKCCWQWGVLGAQLPVPPSGKSSGCPGDQKAPGHSPGKWAQGGPACARWEWTRWSLEAPSNLSHSMFSVISKKTGLTEMWKVPQGVKCGPTSLLGAIVILSGVLILSSLSFHSREIFYIFFSREQNGDSVLMGLKSHWVQVVGLM